MYLRCSSMMLSIVGNPRGAALWLARPAAHIALPAVTSSLPRRDDVSDWPSSTFLSGRHKEAAAYAPLFFVRLEDRPARLASAP